MHQIAVKLWRYATANIGFYFALFILLWVVAWTANAIWQTKFDLAKLEEMGKFVLGKYGVDSTVNTKFQTKDVV